jgi:hypothetical protein
MLYLFTTSTGGGIDRTKGPQLARSASTLQVSPQAQEISLALPACGRSVCARSFRHGLPNIVQEYEQEPAAATPDSFVGGGGLRVFFRSPPPACG